MNSWALPHSAEPNRAEFECGALTTCGHKCGFLNLILFYFIFNILLIFWFLTVLLWPVQSESDLHNLGVVATTWTCTILVGAVATAGCSNAINIVLFRPSLVHETTTSKYSLSPSKFLQKKYGGQFWSFDSRFGDFFNILFHFRVTNLCLSRGLVHRPELGAGDQSGSFYH